MAKRRTKEEKQQAKQQRAKKAQQKDSSKSSSDRDSVAAIAFTGEKVHLVKRDLLKTVALTAIIVILLFGIYLYLR